MNAPATGIDVARMGCRDLALAALGALLPSPPDAAAPAEARFLHEAWQRGGAALWPQQVARSLALPASGDDALLRLAALLELPPIEVLALALSTAVEDDALVGRLLDWLQGSGHGGSRPSLALLARALAPLMPHAVPTSAARAEAEAVYALAFGRAVCAGALQLDGDDRALNERTLRVPGALAAALAGIDVDWPQARRADERAHAGWPLDAALLDAWAQRLAAGGDVALAIRSASAAEGRALAAALADRLQRRPAWFARELPPAADLWLVLTGRLPVFALDGAPLELQTLPALGHYRGPVLVLAGPDVGLKRGEGVLADWRVPLADAALRRQLWRSALGDTPAAERAARRYLAAPSQLAEQAQLARLLGASDDAEGDAQIAQAARMTATCRALDALAEPLPDTIGDDALVLGETQRQDLARVLQRCEQRESLHARLGPAARTRAGSGVRLLFTGASGTGKSLAAQWLATRLGLPIYRVDLASMLSKWIGETEKNLAELLSRAEAAGVVLLFDEADTLFGKRTEVASANDRFANAQTNYLLQRIESFAGIAVLTSNSRSRFDPAFVRRLDFIVDFAAPDAQARRSLWQAHLGDAHALDAQALNRLAALADLAGGHIRNAVLAAAACAAARDAPIGFDDVADGVRAEYRKLGRTPPLEL